MPVPATQLLQAALSLGMSRRVSRAARCETRLCYGASRLQRRGPGRLETVDWNSIAEMGEYRGAGWIWSEGEVSSWAGLRGCASLVG